MGPDALSRVHRMLPHRALAFVALALACKDERPGGLSPDVPFLLSDAGFVDRPMVDVVPDRGVVLLRDGSTDLGSSAVTPFRPLAPSSGAWLRSLRPTFRWTALPAATSYRVELSTTRTFDTVESTATSATTSYVSVADLPRGLRWWRVVALDGAMELRTSAVWPVTLGRALHDLNGDGRADIVVGAPGLERVAAGPTGEVHVHLGGTAIASAPDLTLAASNPGERFGGSVSTSGDLNGDGFADLVVGAGSFRTGAPTETGESGRVAVYLGGASPSTSATLQVAAPVASGGFGRSVAIVGDYNGDGYGDLVVGAPAYGGLTGRAWLYLGGSTPDAMPDAEFTFAMPFDAFGSVVAGAGDLNGDGFADVVIGAPQIVGSGVGEVRVFFGSATPNASVDQNFLGAANDVFGSAVAGAGDVDGDGYGDLAVGAPSIGGAGRVVVFAGSVGSLMRPLFEVRGAMTMGAGERLGNALEGAGDVNGDGFGDLVVGASTNAARRPGAGVAYLFVGGATPSATAALTYETTEDEGALALGDRAVGAGDVDGDGFDDVLLRAGRAPSGVGVGAVYLLRGGAAPTATRAWTSVGPAAFVGSDYGAGLALRVARRPRYL